MARVASGHIHFGTAALRDERVLSVQSQGIDGLVHLRQHQDSEPCGWHSLLSPLPQSTLPSSNQVRTWEAMQIRALSLDSRRNDCGRHIKSPKSALWPKQRQGGIRAPLSLSGLQCCRDSNAAHLARPLEHALSCVGPAAVRPRLQLSVRILLRQHCAHKLLSSRPVLAHNPTVQSPAG